MVESQQDSLYMDSQNSLGSLGLIEGLIPGDLLPLGDSDMAEFNQFSPNTINEIEMMIPNHQQHKYTLAYNPEQQFSTTPIHFGQLPSTEQLETNWSFDIELNSESASKTSWMFSTKLNKVFVKINTHLNVYAKFNVIDPNQILFLRAMVVYQQSNDFAEPVRKCPNHRDQSTMPYPEHILRCSTMETEYLGTETGKLFEDKLSLRIPMAKIATGEPLKLQFTCQNSCSGGMNRRHTSVIFTLENSVYEVLGRKILNFKVCSCPKRDKEKDEEVFGKILPKKRKIEQQPTTSKKVAVPLQIIKQESDMTMSANSDASPLPLDLQSVNSAGLLELKCEQTSCNITLTLPNQELKNQVLKYAYDAIAGSMTRTNDVGLQNYLTDIQKLIDEN